MTSGGEITGLPCRLGVGVSSAGATAIGRAAFHGPGQEPDQERPDGEEGDGQERQAEHRRVAVEDDEQREVEQDHAGGEEGQQKLRARAAVRPAGSHGLSFGTPGSVTM